MNERNDPEQAAATALLRACGDWLATQEAAQPAAMSAIRERLAAATEVQFSVTMLTGGDRSASMRIVALDGEGSEVMRVRAITMAPPARGPVQ